MAVGASGNAYVGDFTESSNFPTTARAPSRPLSAGRRSISWVLLGALKEKQVLTLVLTCVHEQGHWAQASG